MKDKKTCAGCRALKSCSSASYCELGFRINEKNSVPLEPCPKPRTYLDLLECRADCRRGRL